MASLWVAACCGDAALCAPASALASLPSPLGGLACLSPCLEPAGGLLGLLDVFLAGAPEEQPAGHAPDRDRDVQATGDPRTASVDSV